MGTGERSGSDPAHWQIVLAPAPSRKFTKASVAVREAPIIRLFTPLSVTRNYFPDGWSAKLGEYAGLVHAGIPSSRTRGLFGTRALARGLNRPVEEALVEDSRYVYVTNPGCTFRYTSPYSSPERAPAALTPKGAVFCTYVDIWDQVEDAPEHEQLMLRENDATGIVRGWEFVKADPDRANLPAGWESRYTKRLWTP